MTVKTIFNELTSKKRARFYADVESYKKTRNLEPFIAQYMDSLATNQILFMYSMFNHILHGEHSVMLGNKLYSMFKDTDLHKIPVELFNLPFEAFYIQLPDNNKDIIEGIFVTKIKDFHNIGKSGSESESGSEDIRLIYATMEQGEINTRYGSIPDMTPDKDGFIDLEQIILADAFSKWPSFSQKKSDILVEFVRIVCNTIVYMNSTDADVKTEHNKNKSNKKSKLKARTITPKAQNKRLAKKAKSNNTAVIWLGKDIEDNPDIQSIPTGKSNNWSVRRGHWHSFWIGSRTDPVTEEPRKGEELILKWVRPIYRNIVNAPEKQRQVKFVK